MDYKKMYFELFNSLTDFIKELQGFQQKMEQIIISDESNEPDKN